MPTHTPTISFQSLRNICERWQWRDPSGILVTGYNPPADATDRHQKPFYVKYVTGRGHLEQGEVICLKVDTRRHQRKVKFTASNEIRVLRDYLIISVDGLRVVTH